MEFAISHDESLCSSLSKTAAQAILNMTLLFLLLLSSAFKLYRVVNYHSAKALSFMYIFLGALFNVSQVCISLTGSFFELGTADCHFYIHRFGLGALNSLLLLLISGTILVCSLILYYLSLNYEQKQPSKPTELQASPNRDASPLRASRRKPGNCTPYNLVLGIWITIFLVPNLLLLVVEPIPANVSLVFWLKPTFYFHLTVLPILLFGLFGPQVLFMWKERHNLDKLPLDIPSFATDTIIFILVGISWRQLLAEIDPIVLWFWFGWTHPLSWQQWGTWQWFNYILLGLGQGIMLGLYLYLRRRYRSGPSIRKEDLGEHEHASVEANETDPLLRGCDDSRDSFCSPSQQIDDWGG